MTTSAWDSRFSPLRWRRNTAILLGDREWRSADHKIPILKSPASHASLSSRKPPTRLFKAHRDIDSQTKSPHRLFRWRRSFSQHQVDIPLRRRAGASRIPERFRLQRVCNDRALMSWVCGGSRLPVREKKGEWADLINGLSVSCCGW